MSAKGKVARNKNGSRSARHGRESDHVCSSLTSPPTAGSSFKACGHNLAGAASSCGPPGDGKPLDLTQLSSEQRSKLESFLKTSGFGPLPKAGQTLDAATMRKLAHHMRAAAALPSKSSIRNWADTEKNPKDGLVRQAVSSSKRDDVKNLLEEGGDVDEVEPKTLCTPLMLAVRDGSKEIVQILLDYDADVTRRDKDGRTAIMEACAAGRDDLVQLLIDHGSCVADTDNSNWNSLTHCAANGHVRSANVVMRHLKYDKDSQEKLKEIVKKEDKIKKKDPKAASTAKVVSPDLDDYDDAECPAESALATAAHKGQFEFVKFYLSHKDQFHVTETELQAACSKACYSKRLDLLRFLIEEHGAKVNPESPIAETPLCSASASGDLDMVRYLLQRGARVNDYDGNGFSPLMRACNEGHAAIIPVLLQHGANVNAQNSQYENWTPLCFAILKSNMEIVQSLVTAHANVNLGGTAPLLLAVSFNNMQIVEYLLAHGSNPTQKSQHGDAAINFAADVGNLEWVKRFHTLGCDVDCVGDKGQTPLMKAAKKGSLEVVEYLLDNGASINRVSLSNDSSALSQACSKGWIKIIEFLLERGANRHIKLKDGVTPLLEAVKSGNAEAADLVLYYQPKNAEFRESSGGHRGHTCDHLGDVGSHIKAAMTPMKEFYLNMNYSCKHCDGHHGEPARTTSEHSSDDEEIDEEDGEDGDEDEDSEDHIGCEDDEEEEDPEECESGEEEEELDDPNYTSDEDESGDDEQDKKDFIADSENFELPEIYPDDLEKLGFSATDSYSVKEGLDADIDFIRTQLSHFQPQSFEFRILNAMLRKAEQLQVRRQLPIVTGFNMLTNLLQKSLPHHTPEELRRRFSEEISRWQTELQSNANVDDLMDKLVTEPADDETLEGDEPGLADIAAFLQANPTVLDYPSLLMQRTDVYPGGEPAAGSVDSATAVSLNKDGKPGLTLSPDGKYIIMTNSGNSNFQAPLNEFEFLRSIAAAADANAASGGSLVNGIEHLPEELAKVMADARKHGVFNMESFSNFFQGAREDPQFLEDYRNAIRVPASFNFSSSTPPASLAPIPTVGVYGAAPPAAARKPSSAAAGAKADVMPKLESRRPSSKRQPVMVESAVAPSLPAEFYPPTLNRCEACAYCLNGGICCVQPPAATANDKVKAPRTPEPTPDDTSEEGFEGSDDVPSLEVKPPIFKPEGRSAKKTIRSTRDVATNVTNSAAPPAKKPALVDVDQQQESDSSTALIHAAIRGNAKMIATLCDAGAKPNHKDKKGWTALGYAVERGYKEAVKELCEHGAELDVVMDTNQAKRDSSLTIACYNGRAEIVRILLDFKASTKDYTGLIEHRNSNDYTPLCVACLNGHHRVAQMLIQRGADINARGTKLGISPLMLASMNGHTTIVKLLIESNADVNQCIETNRNTALTLACFQGRTECVRVLVEKGANLEWRSKNGLNALMEAANGGFHEIGKILVDAGAEVDCAPVPSTKDTPLTIAAEKGHAKFCQLLIDNGAQVNLRNKKGCSPLWLACQNGHFDVVQALVGCGSADVDARDNRQMSCILTAFKRGHENIVRTLVDYIHCYPSEDEMTRYCREVKMNGNNSYLLSVYDRCKKAILDAKKKKEAEANQIANSLLEEVEMQQKIKESQKAKKREKKLKQKKKGKNDDDDSSVTGVSNTRTYDSEPPSPVASRSASEVRAAEAPGKNKPVAAVVEAPPEPAEDEEDEPEKGESSKKKKKRKNKVKGKAAADGADQVSAPITVAAPPAAAKSATVETPAATPKKPSTSSGPAVKKLEPVNAVTTPRPSTAPVQPTPPQPVDVDDNDENQWLSPSPPDVDEWIQQRSRSQKSSSTNAAAATTSHAQLPNQFELSSKNDPRRTLTNTLRQEGWKEVVGRSKRFKVPTSAIARIIGKAGTNINAIRASTCAHIEIEKNKPGINDRLITVRGTSEAVAEAYHIIKTLSDNPDRDLEELLRQTKLNSAEITRATVSQPSDVPVLIKPVPMPAEIESRRPRPSTQAPPAQAAATTHSTQVFTNSQMQQHRPQPPPPPPISTAAVVSTTAPENYSSVVAASSQQKRSSIHSSSSKESQEAVARVAADRDQQSANSPVSQRASPKGMASSSPGGAGDARNAQPVRSPAPASSPAMVKKTTVSGAIRPPPPSPQVLMKQQQQPQPVEEPKVVRLPTPTTCSSSQASSPSKPPSTVPPTTPGKSSTILGTLYQDLMMERNHWMPEPSLDLNFFTKDSLGPSSGPSDYQHQITPRESRLGSVFASGFDSSLQSSSSSSNLTPQFGGFSANRPASLPQDLRASRQSDTSDYGVGGPIHNGFISPGYPTVNNNNSGMDPYSGGGSAYPPGTYGALANGHASSSIKYHPHGDSDEWLTNGGGVSGFSGSGGGGYSAFPKSDVDTERFMQLAANLAANLDQEQYFPLSGGGSQYGGNGRRGMMNGGSDFDSTSHDLGYNFDEPIPPVVSRGSRLMKPPTDSSGFGLGNGNYGGGNAPSSLGGYGWDSSLFGFGASGDPTALGTFGPISSAVPNAAGNRGTTRVNGSGGGLGGPSSKDAMKTSPQQQSSGDRRNY